jgi:hypothetical protein
LQGTDAINYNFQKLYSIELGGAHLSVKELYSH